ncbi:hypothetical protein [Microbacterium sp. EST19A]|uniref:hypothetical protein n=1 Tax=Microbacterium sp. EST19A TaxID=2862681 RepID=UPI001CBB951B|nr:hypothetical protein [Microbacterium sp. EST19A]
MTLLRTVPASADAAALAGRAVIGRIRRVLMISVVAVLGYAALTRGSAGYCAGGVDSDGGFIDASGQAVDEAPRCVQLTLGPSPVFFVGIALIILIAIGRVMKASDESTALRTLDRAALIVVALVIVAIVVSWVWLRLVPIEDFARGGGTIFSPFPFGFIDVDLVPMTGP